MKTSLLSIFAFAIAIGPVIGAQDQDEVRQPKNRTRVAPSAPRPINPAPRTFSQTPKVQRNVNVPPRFQPRVNTQANVGPRFRPRVNTPPTNRVYTPSIQASNQTFTPPDQDAPRPPRTVRSDVNLPNNSWRTRIRQNPPSEVTPQPPQTPTTTTPPDTTVQSDTTVRNRDWRNRDWQNQDRNRDWRNRRDNTNRNWQNHNTSGTFTYDQARRHHHRQRHHRSWWRSRYHRIALFAGGYYYWNNNYWYPAYGYDPYYSTYTYDEPIYGYNDLPPGQVIANVQTALQQQGYYDDAVDGLIGPRTRAALSDFQRDNGLPITAAIDGPTLKALGLY